MENKKTKLTISGSAKKSLKNIEIAKRQSKNSVVIDQQKKFSNKHNLSKSKPAKLKPLSTNPKNNLSRSRAGNGKSA